ncbi:hypothetical protein KR009_005147, partial [Drosophila setifemur]
ALQMVIAIDFKYRKLYIYFAIQMCMSHVTFTNLNCSSYNMKYAEFSTCKIKAINRTHKYMSIYFKVYQLPITNNFFLKIKIKFMRFDHGYQPFFIDLSYDGCQFLKAGTNTIARMFYNSFRNSSNINHTCPYNHDIILDKLWTGNLEREFGRFVPIPNGDYAIYTEWRTESIARASIKIYMRIS